jgi:endoplasmic reticulum resident protein 44
LTAFVREQLQVSINEFPNSQTLDAQLDKTKRNVVAYYHCRDCPEYQNFQKVAALLREDCAFWVGTNEALKAMKENMLLFRDPDTQGEQKVCVFQEFTNISNFSSLETSLIMNTSSNG